MNTSKQTVKKQTGPVNKSSQKEKKLKGVVPSFFDKSEKTSRYVLVGILAFVSFLVFREFLLFHRIFMFKDIGSDSLNVYYPNIFGVSNYIRNYGTLSWSFNLGMGQDCTPTAFFDILNALLFLLPPSKMAFMLGYNEVIKIILGGIVFYLFLRKLGNSSFAAIAGAIMFAFSGYMIVGGEWYIFSLEGLETAIVLLGFEFLFQDNKPWLLPIPFFLIGISNPFNLFPISVFLIIYAVFRYLQENRTGIKDLFILFLKIAGLGIIAVAMSAPLLAEHIKAMLESPRVSGTNSYFATLSSTPIFSLVDPVQLGTCIDRFFSSDLLGTSDQFKGYINYLEAPLFYCGIPCLILTPLFFGFLSTREVKLYGGLLAIWLLPIIFPYFRHAFWLFSGDYYRTYSLYVDLVFLIFSAKCLSRIARQDPVKIVLLFSVMLCLILIQFFPFFGEKNVLNTSISFACKIFVLIYAGLLFWISRQGSDIPKYAFLAVLIIELTWFSSVSANRSAGIKAMEWNDKIGYNDYTGDAVRIVKSMDNSFYRFDKPVGSSPAEHTSLNDGLVQNYYGTSCYSSFNQKYYINYLLAYNVIDPKNESQSRWSAGLTGRPILQSINSVKYIITKEHMTPSQRPGYDSLISTGDVIVYKNNFVLPLGYCYSSYVKFSDFLKMSTNIKDFTSLEAAVIGDSNISELNGLKQFNLKDTVNPQRFTLTMYRDDVNNLKSDTLRITNFNPAHISGELDLKMPKLLYMSIPYDIGWHLTVDGQPHHIILVGNGMTGAMLTPGKHNIQLDYLPPYRNQTEWLALAGLLMYGGLIFGYSVRRKKRADEKA